MNENKFGVIQLIKAAVIFLLFAVATAFIFAAGMYFLEDGYEFSPLFASLCLAFGSFAASFYCGNARGEKGLLIGLMVGGTIFIITALITLLVNSGAVSIHLLLRFIILLLASFIGAIIGVNKKANKKFI